MPRINFNCDNNEIRTQLKVPEETSQVPEVLNQKTFQLLGENSSTMFSLTPIDFSGEKPLYDLTRQVVVISE